MKEYVCHKRVKAAVIVDTLMDCWSLVLRGADGEEFVSGEQPSLFARYTPVPGDYLVEYAGGYRSISPKAAFESGYTEV